MNKAIQIIQKKIDELQVRHDAVSTHGFALMLEQGNLSVQISMLQVLTMEIELTYKTDALKKLALEHDIDLEN